jgi:hypothetical protein
MWYSYRLRMRFENFNWKWSTHLSGVIVQSKTQNNIPWPIICLAKTQLQVIILIFSDEDLFEQWKFGVHVLVARRSKNNNNARSFASIDLGFHRNRIYWDASIQKLSWGYWKGKAKIQFGQWVWIMIEISKDVFN